MVVRDGYTPGREMEGIVLLEVFLVMGLFDEVIFWDMKHPSLPLFYYCCYSTPSLSSIIVLYSSSTPSQQPNHS